MRNKHRVIYTSSYDRGLQHLLEIWPDVKKAVPDAELHCFYGWQLFERFYRDNASSIAWMKKMQDMMKYSGITDHGRVPQDELRDFTLTCAVWAYPTHFGEISCISAMKAQAYGCEPVVVDYAALQETVQYGRKITGDIYDDETKEQFKTELIDALKNPMSDEKRKEMMDWAQEKYSWDSVANLWSNEFKS